MTNENFAEFEAPSPSRLRDMLRRARKNPGFIAGFVIICIFIVVTLAAPLLAPADPYEQDILARISPPFWREGTDPAHILGTDALGRDYLSRLLYGGQISLLIGTVAVLISATIGTTLGLLAGYFGGRVDLVVSYIIIVRLSMPFVLVALALASFIRTTPFEIAVILGLLLWDRFAVVVRGAAMRLRSADFVTAAGLLGAPTRHIIVSEVLPNILNPLIVIATFEFGQAILAEAALSFLGLGVQAPLPSWGLMVSEGKDFVLFDPWLAALPGGALFIVVFAINLLGDGIRDITAPNSRN